MSGSKKGERRGGARPGHIRKSAAPAAPIVAVKRKAGRPPGAKNKVKVPPTAPELLKILNKRVPVDRKDREVEMYFMITGKRMRMPKDVLLDAMRYFEASAVEYSEVLRANLDAAGAADSAEAQAVLLEAVAQAEGQVDKYVSMAADVAFKAAPYLHPRLAAFLTKPGDGQSATSLFDMLLKDLDEAGKPARYIEHDPNEAHKRN